MKDQEVLRKKVIVALEAAVLLFSKGHAISNFDWGSSALSAQDILELNEIPSKLKEGLAAARLLK